MPFETPDVWTPVLRALPLPCSSMLDSLRESPSLSIFVIAIGKPSIAQSFGQCQTISLLRTNLKPRQGATSDVANVENKSFRCVSTPCWFGPLFCLRGGTFSLVQLPPLIQCDPSLISATTQSTDDDAASNTIRARHGYFHANHLTRHIDRPNVRNGGRCRRGARRSAWYALLQFRQRYSRERRQACHIRRWGFRVDGR